jgi:DNA replication licensing factor MCM3
MDFIVAFNKALKDVALSLADAKAAELADRLFHIGFEGANPENVVTPRTLLAIYIGRLIVLDGIVTRCKSRRRLVRGGLSSSLNTTG